MKTLQEDDRIRSFSNQSINSPEGDDHPLFKERSILAFMQRNKVDRKAILDEQTLFRNWLVQKKKCRECTGLAYCRLKPRGAIKVPYVDESGVIIARYRPCSYANQREEDLHLKKQYLYSHMTDEDYLLRTADLKLKQQNTEYLMTFTGLSRDEQPVSGQGSYVYGAAGSGKTTMLKVVANRLAERGLTISFVYVPELVNELRASGDDRREVRRILDLLKTCDVLILDDIGSEFISQWSRDEVLLPVLDYRYNHNKKTHFSSNYDFDELIEQYTLDKRDTNSIASKRFLDRIFALGKRAYLPGLSKRHDIDVRELDGSGGNQDYE